MRAVARQREEKMVEESISMFGFYRVQKDFYGVTLNGCRLEKGLIWSTESIARQLHHSIKEYIHTPVVVGYIET